MIFVFPGQGSQIVGMGKDIYNTYPVAREVFHEIDDILGKKLSKIIFDGPIEELTITENAQPALMAVSIATLRVIEHLFGKLFSCDKEISYMCGHSVGEYTALCASGALSLASATRLLQVRSTAMCEASYQCEGGMLALLGTEIDEVDRLLNSLKLNDACEIANDNGGGQVVVSGSTSAIKQLISAMKDSSIKRMIRLQVSGPFHSRFMSPAYDIITDFIKNVQINRPSIPIVFNATAKEEDNPQIIKNLITKQIVSRVRWRETILYIAQKGIKKCIEIGPGQVLSNLVKRISSSIDTRSISSISNVHEFISDFSLVE
ncbi:ACP S-malonyltransferase [Candidatus Mesenet endosymbiont of Agriotes lineatus]|uniref:ACP S-malonyltransferase n=1 Tax=Candidatus Mesenet endosymbiont of Agriotes lineatus TaxID=3077948 RepID=UPI0030CC3341